MIAAANQTIVQTLSESRLFRAELELCQNLRMAMQREEKLASIQQATGLQDHALVERLGDAGFDVGTLPALQIYPCVYVGWADGDLSEEERQVILELGCVAGLDKLPAAQTRLQSWLDTPPAPDLWQLWHDYTCSTLASLSPFWRRAMSNELLAQCEQVARASGGILGIGLVCPAERARIDQVREALKERSA